MTKEQLIALGLTEEQATKVLEAHKASLDGNYVPKATFEAEREKVKNLTTTVTDRDKQISELGAFKGTAEQLQQKVTDLEAKNTAAKADFEAQLAKMTNESILRTELTGKVVDFDDVVGKLDLAKIVFKDGKVEKGLTEQLDELKKTKPHYFREESNQTKLAFNIFGTPPKEGSQENKPNLDNPADFGKALAQNKTLGSSVASKANEAYFK